jgi:hypothetical protein
MSSSVGLGSGEYRKIIYLCQESNPSFHNIARRYTNREIPAHDAALVKEYTQLKMY